MSMQTPPKVATQPKTFQFTVFDDVASREKRMKAGEKPYVLPEALKDLEQSLKILGENKPSPKDSKEAMERAVQLKKDLERADISFNGIIYPAEPPKNETPSQKEYREEMRSYSIQIFLGRKELYQLHQGLVADGNTFVLNNFRVEGKDTHLTPSQANRALYSASIKPNGEAEFKFSQGVPVFTLEDIQRRSQMIADMDLSDQTLYNMTKSEQDKLSLPKPICHVITEATVKTIKSQEPGVNNKVELITMQVDVKTERSDLEYTGPTDIKEFQELQEPKNLKSSELKSLKSSEPKSLKSSEPKSLKSSPEPKNLKPPEPKGLMLSQAGLRAQTHKIAPSSNKEPPKSPGLDSSPRPPGGPKLR